MSKLPNEDTEAPQIRRLQAWWLELPLAYRLNALLYFLGAVGFVFLIGTLLSSDGRPRQLQVGSGAPVTTASTSSTVARPTTTRPATTTSGPTTSAGPTTTAAPGATTTTRPAGNTTTTSGPNTTAPDCRNSSNPACGPFTWDPPPASNQPLSVVVSPSRTIVSVGELVQFNVTASDPDHLVSSNCSLVRYDDGLVADAPCNPPPDCPARHGPWTPPAAQPGSHTASYLKSWDTPGEHTVVFTFRSWSTERCLALDPYASEGTTEVTVLVTAATTTVPTTTTTVPPTTSTTAGT